MPTRMPALFVSHGAPTLPFENNASRAFLSELGRTLARPRAILVVSAHWQTRAPRVTTIARPETIHDFYGFPQSLYDVRYPAPGAPVLAETVIGLLNTRDFQARADGTRGLDHGAWSPLMLMFPAADIPTIQLSLQLGQGPHHHFALGRALAPLREQGVLILASGGAVHNLAVWQKDCTAVPAPARRFESWLVDQVEGNNREALLQFRTHPDAAWAHPTDEHLLPLFVAMGAGGQGQTHHRAFLHNGLAMTAFAFTEPGTGFR
ncbi:DODA-type extradiol aromatic ring-opening family dioxygenase [Acanthopleuribacter pedis]|uniref:Dioxygenase n=1 Tax=Acanthopleuribacter pedis TaxID=442870 RepID=A0A8J7QD23_9BACT|nr:class III extradiol ring-cleavage dioxygenase [Acanthopleuribacter pedis]MBO1321894.1 dioxygenase [Acanthopleuribacter pedis]